MADNGFKQIIDIWKCIKNSGTDNIYPEHIEQIISPPREDTLKFPTENTLTLESSSDLSNVHKSIDDHYNICIGTADIS